MKGSQRSEAHSKPKKLFSRTGYNYLPCKKLVTEEPFSTGILLIIFRTLWCVLSIQFLFISLLTL